MADRTTEFKAMIASLPKPPVGIQVRIKVMVSSYKKNSGGKEGDCDGCDAQGQ